MCNAYTTAVLRQAWADAGGRMSSVDEVHDNALRIYMVALRRLERSGVIIVPDADHESQVASLKEQLARLDLQLQIPPDLYAWLHRHNMPVEPSQWEELGDGIQRHKTTGLIRRSQ